MFIHSFLEMAGASFNNDLPNFQTLVSLKNSSLDFPKWSNTLFTAVVNLKNKNKNKGKPQLYVFICQAYESIHFLVKMFHNS